MCLLPSAFTAAAATSRAGSQYGSRSSSVLITRMPTMAPSKCARSGSVAPVRAMAPFRNPFKSKPKEDKGPSGMKVLLEKVQKGSEKAKKEGFQEVLADVRDGISQRNYGWYTHTHTHHPNLEPIIIGHPVVGFYSYISL